MKLELSNYKFPTFDPLCSPTRGNARAGKMEEAAAGCAAVISKTARQMDDGGSGGGGRGGKKQKFKKRTGIK